MSDLPATVGIFPAGPWPDTVETAFVLPLTAPAQSRPTGFLIVGVSPRRILDSDYLGFFELVAGHVSSSIANARPFEAEHKRTEALLGQQRLRESEAWLSAIINQVPGAVGMLDRNGHFILRGGPLSVLWSDIHPSHDPGSIRRWRGFNAAGGPLLFSQYPGPRALRGETVTPGLDFIHTGDDGRERWIRVSSAPFRNEAGEIVGAVSILQDVDEEKRAERRLRESEARLQAAIDLLKLGRYSWNPKTNELQWDDTLRAMWGLPAGALVDYDIWRAGVHPGDRARVLAAIEGCVDPLGDGLYDIEYRVIGQDGMERWIATRGRTNFQNGQAVSFYGIALDVTSRKSIEHLLEQRVERRTRELEDANLHLHAQIEQRQMAEAAVDQLQRLDAVGKITSGVAHDFNNLLAVILSNAVVLLGSTRDPYDHEGLQLIRSAAESGKKLITQLLAFSRKQRLEPQIVDLGSQIAGVNDLLRATLGDTVHLVTRTAAGLWPALVDPTQIELIMLNLAINGRDAMAGSGTLTIEAFNTLIQAKPSRPEDPPPGEYVAIAVVDTGSGIPDDVLAHAFEPFFTTKGLAKGSGLGLAQVFGTVKQSNGGMRIDTRVGHGTSVTVFFPRAATPSANTESDTADPHDGPPINRTRSVLVVDDNEAVLITTLRILKSLGYAAMPAASGAEALQLIASNPDIDLVLADFAMPEMDGVALAEAIRRARPNLPVLLATGYREHKALKEFGEARTLQKPYSDAEVLQKITAALS
jgi:PAS domain S-box-containing protein